MSWKVVAEADGTKTSHPRPGLQGLVTDQPPGGPPRPAPPGRPHTVNSRSS